MKFKIIISVLAVMIVIIISTVAVLCSITTNTKFIEKSPVTINIYKSETDVTETITKNNAKYETIINEYNKMFNITLMDQITRGAYISKLPKVNYKADTWSNFYKTTGLYLEFIYDNIQKVTILDGENTRVIDVKAFIVRLDDSSDIKSLNFYYRSGDTYQTTDNYGDKLYPLIIEAKTISLYNLLIK